MIQDIVVAVKVVFQVILVAFGTFKKSPKQKRREALGELSRALKKYDSGDTSDLEDFINKRM